ncbi:PASTA domain-containing protein [Streptomyces sp. B93]|uniref:PASTA domain-containing protein n=1 Tax=Streptomyces sp. B93 TaxID=2824875 RepID=UPI001B3850D2|nr:hypothetical protein [Streptomyces sp. B93]MBQ1090650.1 hypothetical protein [Streptomyces sp. B93]
MRIRTIAIGLAVAALFTLTACEGTENGSSNKPDTTIEEINGQSKQDPESTEAPTDDAQTPEAPADDTGVDDGQPETAALPNLVGKDLQAAQDEAQAAGFYVLDDQDASGQNRLQILDRNWTVCSQEPDPGTHPTDTLVTLYAVKDDETC